MTKTKKQTVKAKGTRTARSPENEAAALARVEEIGVGAAARVLGINESQLYGWKQRGQTDRQRDSVEQLQAAEIARLKRALADRHEELAIVRKSGRELREAPAMKYAFVQAHNPEFRLCTMLRVFGASASGYHAWRARHPHRARRVAKQEAWEARVRTTFAVSGSRTGSPG
jgi:transposase